MTIGEILLAIVTGLAVNECCDVSPWVARKLVRWSAHRRYVPPARAELRAEELAAYIDDRPGKLFKLITALCFATAAIVTRKATAPGIAPPNALWQPTLPAVSVDYLEVESLRHPHAYLVRQSWRQLTAEVRNAARELGVGSCSWHRCIRKLQRITGDDRWVLVAKNLDLLKKINISRAETHGMNRCFVPTQSTVTQYQAAVETARTEIRRLTSDVLLNSAPR